MGTRRGAIGWKIDGKFEAIYNQFDSYLSGLGQKIIEFIQGVKDLGYLRRKIVEARKITLHCGGMNDWTIEGGDWSLWDRTKGVGYLREVYDGLRETLVVSEPCFLRNSLFCEYAYVLDLDNEALMFFEGFQMKKPEKKGPFPEEWYENPVSSANNQYYPVKIIDTFPIDTIKGDFSHKDLKIALLWDRVEVLEDEVRRLKDGRLWYLAHPYTRYWKEEDALARDLPPREHNFREVSEIAGKLLDRGVHIYSPISHTHPIWATQGEMSLEEEYEMYLGLDETIARRCTGLILCEGWETSRGCKEEKKWFEAWGKPIRYVDGEGVDL